jgi:FkbM family methyltransferase
MISTLKRAARLARNSFAFQSILKQDHVRFLGVGNLYFSNYDNRGKAIANSAGATQPRITLFWAAALRILNPTLVLDIGANYGEIALSAKYSANSKIHLFEPNPILTPFLLKSIDSHINSNYIELHTELVSDKSGFQDFFVDEKWSGTSSAIGPISDDENKFKGIGSELFRKISVASIKIDDIFANVGALSEERLLFKIDVEGFESNVICGMQRTLDSVGTFLGVLEFDKQFLWRAGIDPRLFLRRLSEIGCVKALEDFQFREIKDIEELPEHKDIFVASNEKLFAEMEWPFSRRLFRH